MPRRRRPDLGRRSQSNVRRATSRANRTDDQRETDQENSRIAMSELRSLVSDNEVDRLRMQRVRAHQTQQQRARHNEIERFRRRSAPVILERAAFHYDPAIEYCADKSVTIGEMTIICKYCKALKYSGESTGLCCAIGKVKFNATIQNFLPGQLVSFKSVDTVMNQDDVVNYPTEFLNSLELPGLPPHNLQLKVGSVVIMLRNINQPRLCNGTRLAVKKVMNNVIEATIIKGKYKGEDVLIPRIPMIPTDLPFDFKRLQFPVRLAFAMTINKSQGQSLEVCGINLEFPCFAPQNKTKNIVYQKGLN